MNVLAMLQRVEVAEEGESLLGDSVNADGAMQPLQNMTRGRKLEGM